MKSTKLFDKVEGWIDPLIQQLYTSRKIDLWGLLQISMDDKMLEMFRGSHILDTIPLEYIKETVPFKIKLRYVDNYGTPEHRIVCLYLVPVYGCGWLFRYVEEGDDNIELNTLMGDWTYTEQLESIPVKYAYHDLKIGSARFGGIPILGNTMSKIRLKLSAKIGKILAEQYDDATQYGITSSLIDDQIKISVVLDGGMFELMLTVGLEVDKTFVYRYDTTEYSVDEDEATSTANTGGWVSAATPDHIYMFSFNGDEVVVDNKDRMTSEGIDTGRIKQTVHELCKYNVVDIFNALDVDFNHDNLGVFESMNEVLRFFRKMR